MSNMSYCRFENTLGDLDECYTALINNEKLSESERVCRKALIQLCRDIVDDFGDYTDADFGDKNYNGD